MDKDALATLVAKDEIRDLVLLYSRGVDRKDGALLRSLYTSDGVDHHDETYRGNAEGYVDFLEKSFPYMPYSGHHVCNHLISVDGDEGEGEVYALAYHMIPGRDGGMAEDFMCVRYIDKYRKETGRWRFAAREVVYDYRSQRKIEAPDRSPLAPEKDPTMTWLQHRLFHRGPRG